MKGGAMQQLPGEFTTRYYNYSQLAREGNIVLMRRVPRASGRVCHEVALVGIVPAHVSAAGFAIDDTEVYPQDEAMDNSLWRYDSLRDAEQQFKRLCTRAAQPATDQPAPVVVVHAGLQEDAGQGGTP